MITIKQQKFLLELLIKFKQGRKFLTRGDVIKRPIFSNDSDFYKQIRELISFGYIKNEKYDNYRSRYSFKANGWAFANIIAKQNNTEERFRKIAEDIIWILD